MKELPYACQMLSQYPFPFTNAALKFSLFLHHWSWVTWRFCFPTAHPGKHRSFYLVKVAPIYERRKSRELAWTPIETFMLCPHRDFIARFHLLNKSKIKQNIIFNRNQNLRLILKSLSQNTQDILVSWTMKHNYSFKQFHTEEITVGRLGSPEKGKMELARSVRSSNFNHGCSELVQPFTTEIASTCCSRNACLFHFWYKIHKLQY